MDLSAALEARCRALDLPYDAAWARPIGVHLDLLARWSQVMNLTTVASPEEALERHVVDSLALLRLDAVSTSRGPAADLGSGAGFPGLPLAIALPDVDWTLIEPRRKRGVFLQKAIHESGVKNARWLEASLPDPRLADRYALVVSRATFPPQDLLAMAAPLLAPGGALAVMAATPPEWDLSGWRLIEQASLRIAGAPRWLGAVRRAGAECQAESLC